MKKVKFPMEIPNLPKRVNRVARTLGVVVMTKSGEHYMFRDVEFVCVIEPGVFHNFDSKKGGK